MKKFILNFYKKHYTQYNPKASYINWNTNDDFIDFLTKMKSDIMLEYGKKIFIIDSKYYSHKIQNNSRYDKRQYTQIIYIKFLHT